VKKVRKSPKSSPKAAPKAAPSLEEEEITEAPNSGICSDIRYDSLGLSVINHHHHRAHLPYP